MQIEIIFLGTGSGIPTIKRSHPAILINYNGDYLLFDCGENCQIGLQKAKVSPLKINRIFITHWHADHFAGLIPLIETMHLLKREKPLYIYAPDASEFVDSILDMSYWSAGFELIAKNVSDFKKIFSSKKYDIFSMPVKHSVPSFGYIFREKGRWNINMQKAREYGLSGKELQVLKENRKINKNGRNIKLKDVADYTKGRKIIYSGDTEIYEEVFKKASGSVLIHDSTFIDEGRHKHSSAIDVATLAKNYKVKKLILTHFSRRYKNMSVFKKAIVPIFKNVIFAEDGMRVFI